MDAYVDYGNILRRGGYVLLDSVVYNVRGKGFQKFLGSITCNALDKEKNAFLDRWGRLIVLVDQLLQDDCMYIVVPDKFEARFTEHLGKYLPFSGCTMAKTRMNVVHIIGAGRKFGRLSIRQRIGFLVLANTAIMQEISNALPVIPEKEYVVFRLENNISLQGADFDSCMFLETNWEDTVSYSKGCYLGQEVMARVRAYGKPPKKLVRILYGTLPEKVTSQGNVAGRITSQCFSQKYGKHLVFAVVESVAKEFDGGTLLQE